MPQLPTKIRVDIRDHYDPADSAVQKAITALTNIVGYPVSIELEWAMLWAELEQLYPDKATFVPTVAGVLQSWCNALSTRLLDDRFPKWTEELLDKLSPSRQIKVYVQVSNTPRPSTTWETKTSSFTLNLPKSSTTSPARAISGFETDLETIFAPKTVTFAGTTSSIHSLAQDDEWADIGVSSSGSGIGASDTAPHSTSVAEGSTTAPAPPKLDVLPTLSTLPRPDILFRDSPPYLLHITSSGAQNLTIWGSHQPSLELLAEYFQKWARMNPNDVRKNPRLSVTLAESHFGLGSSRDCVRIAADDRSAWIEVNPAAICAFVEAVLGYRQTFASGASWEYRRDVGFRV
ncbi:MAG: hypothetical protein M1824_006077 [Vezdaea acicularis]|nr:MAG: hypothetical protein M1824_006077 [Vezdaea acicularis]